MTILWRLLDWNLCSKQAVTANSGGEMVLDYLNKLWFQGHNKIIKNVLEKLSTIQRKWKKPVVNNLYFIFLLDCHHLWQMTFNITFCTLQIKNGYVLNEHLCYLLTIIIIIIMSMYLHVCVVSTKADVSFCRMGSNYYFSFQLFSVADLLTTC